jgi:tRNA threonylcarbamoyladenosine biosynthesis protein TsaE
MKSLSLKTLSELPETAKQILSFAGDKKIFCFYGELGAGKTTLIKTICKTLNAKDSGSSPTFGLVNEYATASGDVIYHFDFYRIKNETEAFDFGFEEYLYSGKYCFIEWPEKIEHLLPPDIVRVRIEVRASERVITAE